MIRSPIGANAWIWVSPLTDERLVELAPRLRAWGFDLLELPVEAPGDWDPGRAAETLEAAGLGATVCVAMGPGRELCGPGADAAVVADTQAYLRYCIDAAARIGAKTVAGPMYASVGRVWRMDGVQRRAAYATLREHLAPLAEYAGERGIRLGIEPLLRYETSLINLVEQALEALDGLPACGILFDTYHANVEERDVAGALATAGDRLVELHASANDRGTPGADHLDWRGVADVLRATGFDGPVVIESFTAENETIATAASIWRALADSQDALATDGLAFLRSLFAR